MRPCRLRGGGLTANITEKLSLSLLPVIIKNGHILALNYIKIGVKHCAKRLRNLFTPFNCSFAIIHICWHQPNDILWLEPTRFFLESKQPHSFKQTSPRAIFYLTLSNWWRENY